MRFIPFFLLLSLQPARAEPLGAFLQRLAVRGRQTRTLQVNFIQRKRMALFRTEVTSKGFLRYEQPDRLRWEILPPDGLVLRLQGQRAELRLPGEKPRAMDLSGESGLGALVQQLMMWLGIKPTSDLTRHYQVDLEQGKGLTRLRLIPKDASLRRRISALELAFDLGLTLRSVRVRQTDGDTVLFEFSEERRNVELPKESFR
jgi:hypothetical protein